MLKRRRDDNGGPGPVTVTDGSTGVLGGVTREMTVKVGGCRGRGEPPVSLGQFGLSIGQGGDEFWEGTEGTLRLSSRVY